MVSALLKKEQNMFADLIDKIIDEYKADPRNKICIDEDTLLASAMEETGSEITLEKLRSVISEFLSGEIDVDDYPIYDGAVYACSVASNNCFGNPEEHEDDDDYSVDYEVDWIENDDGSFVAEIRPS